MIIPRVSLVLLDPPLLDLVSPRSLLALLVRDPLRVLEHGEGEEETLVVFQGKQDIFVLIDLTADVVDLIL